MSRPQSPGVAREDVGVGAVGGGFAMTMCMIISNICTRPVVKDMGDINALFIPNHLFQFEDRHTYIGNLN